MSISPYVKDITVIAMTANAFDEDRKDAVNAGMDGHITKPFKAESLKKEIWKIYSEKMGKQ